MSSSRPTRQSSRRLSSPFIRAGKDPGTPPTEREKGSGDAKKTFMDNWVEPPLRHESISPSRENIKAAQRNGTVDMKAPRGTLAGPKAKAKSKLLKPKRVAEVKGVDSYVPKQPSVDQRSSITTRSSEVKKEVDRAPKPPSTPQAPSTTSTRSSSRAPLPNLETRSSQTPTKRESFKLVVDAAVTKATSNGNPQLGLALQSLYASSLSDYFVYHLLVSVFTGVPTKEQLADFQRRIKAARKEIKRQALVSNGVKGSFPPTSKISAAESPSRISRFDSTSTSANNAAAEEITDQDIPQSTERRSKRRKFTAKPVEISVVDDPPAEAFTRTQRMSSMSSLSSVESFSSLDHTFVPPKEEAKGNIAALTVANNSLLTTRSTLLPPSLTPLSASGPTEAPRKRSFTAVNVKQTQDSQAEAELQKKLKRLLAKNDFSDLIVNASSMRNSLLSTDAASMPPSDPPPVIRAPKIYLRNGSARTALSGAKLEPASPSSSFPGDTPSRATPPSVPLSRAASPPAINRPTKRFKRAARIKQSPIKKRNGVIAGIGRANGEAESPIGYAPTDMKDMIFSFPITTNFPDLSQPKTNANIMGDIQNGNDDFCAACSGSGALLCCDGCDRSFHFTCLDPPMDSGELPDSSWYCHVCAAKRNPQPPPARGLFSGLLHNLVKKNPVAYSLPLEIREYFEGVTTGDQGEYTETLRKINKATHDDTPDYLKLKDAKGSFVLCHKCGKSSLDGRQIIPCNICTLSWHTDCLDPPMAKIPTRDENGKRYRDWMCPNHADHELKIHIACNSNSSGKNVLHKVRRPKHPIIVDTALRRGFKNNGMIEIENENEESDGENGFYDHENFGRVFRLSEKGIKLDFISAIRRSAQLKAKANRSASTVHEINGTPIAKSGSPASPTTAAMPSYSDKGYTLAELQGAIDLLGLQLGHHSSS
ncbi:MAG: hypothetical protein M1829_001902 [Trizodia sp. TS-e1964]|nr:MAG: hypothetical protein M1829_001902 [Trizodia sp. TS-e1964]